MVNSFMSKGKHCTSFESHDDANSNYLPLPLAIPSECRFPFHYKVSGNEVWKRNNEERSSFQVRITLTYKYNLNI